MILHRDSEARALGPTVPGLERLALFCRSSGVDRVAEPSTAVDSYAATAIGMHAEVPARVGSP
jgi:hypothetical protein